MTTTDTSVRVLIALDIPADQAQDIPDLLASIRARVDGEAGWLDTGEAVMPTAVTLAAVHDLTPITEDDLRGIYEVGVEGVE